MIDPIQTTPPLGAALPTDSNAAGGAATSPAGVALSVSGASQGATAPSPAPAAAPLRLTIVHDKATDSFVYQLYDAGGRLVKEIPQETLADAQKQVSYSAGDVINTSA